MEERREPHAGDSSSAKPLIPPPLKEEKDGDNFLRQFIRRFLLFFFFFLSLNGNSEEVLKHSYGFHIADIPSSNRMIHCGLHYCCVHCHCVIEERRKKKKWGAASNYNRGHICSQCFL